MMYIPIVLVVVWSLIFIEIDSMTPHTESETSLTNAVRKHFDVELDLLNVVELYYKKINGQSSSSSSQSEGIPDDREAVALIQASFFTFWMAVSLRIYSVFNIYIYSNEREETYDLYFSEMMFAFTEFKKAIKKYYGSNRKKTKSKSAVIDADSNGGITVREAADLILGLSLEFVSSKSTLEKKKPDKHRNGIILWDLLEEYQIKNKSYKTVFPSYFIIQKKLLERDTEMTGVDKDIYRYYVLYGNDRGRRIGMRFDETNTITFNSTENEWNYVYEKIFDFLRGMVWQVINLTKVQRIQDFLVAATFGNETTDSVKETLHNRAWILPLSEHSFRMWNTVLQQNFVNSRISTQERIENVIAVVRSIRDVDKVSYWLQQYFQ